MVDLLESVKRIHFIGIGGSGMSPLAEILHAGGYIVSGSDEMESDNVARLRSVGIPVFSGHAPEQVEGAALVVYTVAVSPENPELAAARCRRIPLLERAALLALLSGRYRRTVAVGGTHGKTTTTSMLAQILLQGGFDPTVFIGGRLPLIGANGRAGQSDIFVCEACEFRDHYLQMDYALAVVLNVDADHLDYFGSLDGVIDSFSRFAAKASEAVICNADDPHAREALRRVGRDAVCYGTSEANDWCARDVRMERGAYARYRLFRKGTFFADIALEVPGVHQIGNSMAAAAAAFLCGADAEQIASGLAAFGGAGRRFERVGEVGGVVIADDYAHHPTEITATLQTASAMGYNRIWAVFQPFTYTRTARHLDEFAAALSRADTAIVCDILGSRETNESGVSSEQIVRQMTNGVYLPGFEEIADYIARHARGGDLVLTMGGGNIYRCARMIRDRLESERR